MAKQLVGESPFMKRVLIPFWVIRILVMVIDIAVYALVLIAIGALSSSTRNSRVQLDYGTTATMNTIIAISVVIMVIVLICLILDILCIVKRARRSLTPRFFLIVNVIQTTIFTILFILSMISARTGVTIGIQVIIFLSFLGLLIYASVIFHQSRKGTLKRGAYAPAANPGMDPSFPQNNAANVSYASPAQYPPHPQQQYNYTGHDSVSSTPKPYNANPYGVPQPQQGYAQPQQYAQYPQQTWNGQQHGQKGQQGHELQSR